MTFEDALSKVKDGAEVRRLAWGSAYQWVAAQFPDEHSKMSHPYLYMFTATEACPWVVSHDDLFATDWVVSFPSDNLQGANP